MRPAITLVLALLAGCAPVRDGAHYVVDGVRMEVTRDRTVVDTSGHAPAPPTMTPADAVTLGPVSVSEGMLIRREDGQPVNSYDRPRAEAAFRLYCAARGLHPPVAPLMFDRPDRPTAFFGICRTR